MKNIYLFILTIISITGSAQNQLDPFSISVATTPETCNGNGTMTITPSGLTDGTTVTYSIINNTNSDFGPITTQNTNVNGLIYGNYTVTATQSSDEVGVDSNQAVANNVIIEDSTIPVEFGIIDIQHIVCNDGGSFTVDVTSGTAPYNYQIIDPNNQNSIIVEQDSPTFSVLSAGEYRVRVVDNCGIGRVETVVIEEVILEPITYSYRFSNLGQNCDLQFVTQIQYSGPSNIDNLEWTVSINYTNPNNGAIISSPALTYELSGDFSPIPIRQFRFDIEIFPGETIDYNVVITDPCGSEYTETVPLLNPYEDREITGYEESLNQCGNPYGFVINTYGIQTPFLSKITDIEFTEVPNGVNINDISTGYSLVNLGGVYTATIGSVNNPLETGVYKGNLITCTGQEIPFEYNYQADTANTNLELPTIGGPLTHSEVCDTDNHHYQFSYRTSEIVDIQVLDAPTDGLFYWRKGGIYYNLYFSNYAPGNYEIQFTNECGITETKSIEILPIEPFVFSTISIEKVCGGFNLIHENDNSEGAIDYRYLQYYDEDLGGWTSPLSNSYDNYLNDLSSLSISEWNNLERRGIAYELDGTNKDAPNYSSNPDLLTEGLFRIIKRKGYVIIGENNTVTYKYCLEIDEFSNFQNPIISRLYAYECTDNTFNVSVVADYGTPPYRYQIVTDVDAQADNTEFITIDNEDNPLFTGLTAGSYYFRVFDSCGNYTTQRFDITVLGTPQIVTTANCDTNSIQLAVNGVNYLNFEWYKTDAPNNTLGTGNSLDLGVWDSSKAGEYSVRLTSNGSGTCIDETASVVLSTDPFGTPYAGVDFSANILGGPTNLLDLVNANNSTDNVSQTGYFEIVFQSGQNETNSGRLIDNTWYANEADEGYYTIKYVAEGLCTGMDEALITFYNRNVCDKPPVPGNSTEHPPIGISTLNRADDSNNWLEGYSNGWIALESRNGGMVITRADNPDHPESTIEEPVEGMIVFDIDENCIKLYDGVKWGCIYRGCNDNIPPQP